MNAIDPMAPVVRALNAERQTGMPAGWHNPRRDLLAEVERARAGIAADPDAEEQARQLEAEVAEWESGRVRPHLEAVAP